MGYLDTDELNARRDEIVDTIEEYLASDQDFADEIRELENEKDEIDTIEGYCEDFLYGATLIPESEFVDYAQQFAEDIGAVETDGRWPLYCIDWEAAARDLAMDYSLVTYQGTDYYVR